MILLSQILKWLHLLSMIGAFGGLFIFQFGLPPAARRDEANGHAVSRVCNILIGIGFIAGLLNYGLLKGHQMGGHFNGVIALKFILLLAVGALLAMSKKPGKGGLRTVSLVLLAIAALLGTSI